MDAEEAELLLRGWAWRVQAEQNGGVMKCLLVGGLIVYEVDANIQDEGILVTGIYEFDVCDVIELRTEDDKDCIASISITGVYDGPIEEDDRIVLQNFVITTMP